MKATCVRAACAVLFGMGMLGATEQSPAPATLVRELGAADWERRENAFKQLAQATAPETTMLLETACRNPDAEVRHRARRLLLLRRYGMPPERAAEMLPLVEEYLAIPEQETSRKISQAGLLARQCGTDAIRPLLTLMAEAQRAMQTALGTVIQENLENLGSWNAAIRDGLSHLPMDVVRRLGEYPGYLYLRIEDYDGYTIFLLNGTEYLDLEDLTMFFMNLYRLNADKGLGLYRQLTAIARRIYDRFLALCADPAWFAGQALEQGRHIGDILSAYAQDLHRDLLFILTEQGDFDAAMILAPDMYHAKRAAGLAEITPFLKPGTPGERYLAACLIVLAAGRPAGEEQAALTGIRGAWAGGTEDMEDIHYRAAVLMRLLGRTGYEEEEYQRILELPPDDSDKQVIALAHLGDNRYMRLEYEAAQGYFDRVLAIINAGGFRGAEVARLRQQQLCAAAMALMAAGRYDAAVDLVAPHRAEMGYDRGIKVFDNLEFEIILGRALWRSGRTAEKQARITEVRTFYNTWRESFTKGEWLNNMAWYLARAGGDTATAIRFSEESLQMEPGNDSYLDTLAECWYVHGDRAQAIKYIREAIKHNSSENILAYYQKQLARFETGGP